MFKSINSDIIELIIKNTDIQTYLKCKSICRELHNILNTSSIYYYFTKQIFAKKYRVLCEKTDMKPTMKTTMKSRIKFCTNSKCPNKIHLEKTKTVLCEKNLSPELMIEYRDILSLFRRQREDIRIDRTITSEYPIICEICKIHETSYCEDCLLEYVPEVYKHIQNCSDILSEYTDFALMLDLDE